MGPCGIFGDASLHHTVFTVAAPVMLRRCAAMFRVNWLLSNKQLPDTASYSTWDTDSSKWQEAEEILAEESLLKFW